MESVSNFAKKSRKYFFINNFVSSLQELMHHSFICGEKTQWDQSAFACKHEDDVIIQSFNDWNK
jgi:hypothetical protein